MHLPCWTTKATDTHSENVTFIPFPTAPVVTRTPLNNTFIHILPFCCRSQWPRDLRRMSAAARLLRSWVRIPPGAWIFFCFECCVLSGRGLCDELITRPQESYRLWCVVVCDLENLKNEEAMTRFGSQRHNKKKCLFLLHRNLESQYNRKCLHYQIFLLTQLITSIRNNFFLRIHQVFQEVKSVEFFIHAPKQVVNRLTLKSLN